MALSAEQRTRVERAFDAMLVEAQQDFKRPRRTLAELGGDVARFQQEETNYAQAFHQYNSNPLRARVQAARKQANDQMTLGATQAQADALFATNINTIKADMMAGVDSDLVNQQSRQQAQQELMQNVTSFNIMGIMTSLVKMISGGNEILNVPNQLLGDILQNRGVDPRAAMDNSYMASAVASGIMGAGTDIAPPAMQQYIATTVASTIAPLPAATPSPAAVLAAANSASPASGPNPAFVAPNGALPPAPAGTPPGRPAAPAGAITIS